MIGFRKMHGLGNDFAVFDARQIPLVLDAKLARRIADRRRGIGCDQLIVIERGEKGADAFMRVFNADGGAVELSGNGARCAARVLAEDLNKAEIRIDTKSGPIVCRVEGASVTVDMGAPRFSWRDIPMTHALDTASFALPVDGFTDKAVASVAGAASVASVAAVSMGNPHCVLFVDDAQSAPVETLGPVIETHPWFPARTNVEFVEVRSERNLRMRVWERGTGVTQACGTGACAAIAAAHRRGLTGRDVAVELDGGVLDISWRESDDHILMTGPAILSFTGEVDLAALAGGS